jgi:hypothetical protein
MAFPRNSMLFKACPCCEAARTVEGIPGAWGNRTPTFRCRVCGAQLTIRTLWWSWLVGGPVVVLTGVLGTLATDWANASPALPSPGPALIEFGAFALVFACTALLVVGGWVYVPWAKR